MAGFLASAGGAALIQGGASLLQGVLGGGNDSGLRQRQLTEKLNSLNWKRQKYMARNSAGWQMQDLVDTARQNGIHPLAALGTQGAAQYTPAQSTGSEYAHDSSSNAFIGDSVSDALNTFLAVKQADHRRKMDEAELELLKAQSKTLEAEARRTETEAGITAGIAENLGDNTAEPGRTTVTQVEKDADGFPTSHPDHRDAETAEARRGNIAQEVQGAKNAWHDNRWQNAIKRLKKKYGVDNARRIVTKYYNTDPEKVIELSKGGKGKKVPSSGISPHFRR